MQLAFDLGQIDVPKEDIDQVLKELYVTCTSCRLSQIHPDNPGLICRGNVRGRMAVIGIAPGPTETQKGRAMVGDSGQLMQDWMRYLDLSTNDDSGDVFITNIVQCLPGSTVVKAHGVIAGYRRWYSGPAVRVRTEHDMLTATPNHPILTSRGWVPFGELRHGDDLIRYDGVGDESSAGPNIHHRPTRFEEVFRSLGEDGIHERMIGSSSDFHGDGTDSDVDVIWTDRLLRDNFKPSVFDELAYLAFILADHRTSSGSSTRSGESSLHTSSSELGLSTRSMVGVASLKSALLERTTVVSQLVPLLQTPEWEAKISDMIADGSVLHASLLREVLERLSGKVTLAKVVEVESIQLAEHVYNLETQSNLYLAENYIISNCQPPPKKTKVKRDPVEDDKKKDEEKRKGIPEQKDGGPGQRDPEIDEIIACFGPRCLRVLRAMPNLEVIMTLGWLPAGVLLGTNKDRDIPRSKTHQGQWFESSILPGIPIFCLSHPAEMMHAKRSGSEAAYEERNEEIKRCLDNFRREYLKSGKAIRLAKEGRLTREALGRVVS